MRAVLYYIVIVNIAAFLLFGYDKYCAKRGMWRIPEATLLGATVIGGSIGAYAGMMLFRHKTRRPVFRVGIPAIIILQLACVIAYMYLFGF